MPKIGEIYQQVREDDLLYISMVVGITEGFIKLGTGLELFHTQLTDPTQWECIGTATIVSNDSLVKNYEN